MKLIKKIAFCALVSGLALNGSAQAWPSFAALPFTEVSGEPSESGGLLNRLGKLYEATKSLAKNTEWLSDSIKYVGRKEVVDSLNNVGNSINYVGRKETLKTLNRLSQSVKNLTEKGITLDTQIDTDSLAAASLCGTGAVAALCGIGIITHTALRDDAKNVRTKYIAGSCLTALGLASVWCSTWLNK